MEHDTSDIHAENESSIIAPPNLQKRDRDILLLSAFIILMAFLLKVEEPRVRLAVWPETLIPQSCFSRIYFGIDCPGCGLTRSFIYLANGELTKSLSANRVGWFLALGVLFQIPFRIASLRTNGLIMPVLVRKSLGWTVVVILISNWVYNLFA